MVDFAVFESTCRQYWRILYHFKLTKYLKCSNAPIESFEKVLQELFHYFVYFLPSIYQLFLFSSLARLSPAVPLFFYVVSLFSNNL